MRAISGPLAQNTARAGTRERAICTLTRDKSSDYAPARNLRSGAVVGLWTGIDDGPSGDLV
jgi:hypothetical protein